MSDETPPAASNKQGLDIRSTPRDEMGLFPLDTFEYEYPGREILIEFEMPEFTAICPFSDFPDFGTIKLKYVPGSSLHRIEKFETVYQFVSRREDLPRTCRERDTRGCGKGLRSASGRRDRRL